VLNAKNRETTNSNFFMANFFRSNIGSDDMNSGLSIVVKNLKGMF